MTKKQPRLDAMPLIQRAEWMSGLPFHHEPHCRFCNDNNATKGSCIRFRELAEMFNASDRTVARWVECGINIKTADKVATHLGWNPMVIWGDDWFRP